MMRNIHEPSSFGAINANRSGVKRLGQKPGAFRWWEPGCTPGSNCTGDEPALDNSWAQPGAPLEKFAFRLHSDGSLEFKGHLDSQSATSGTVAVTLPGAAPGEPDFRPANDQFFHTVIYDGVDPMAALVYVEAATGDVTITFPFV